jgi:hypothetical protein
VLSNNELRNFKENTPLPKSVMDFSMFVNNYTEKRAHNAYISVNSQSPSFEVLKSVLYLSSVNIQNEYECTAILRSQNIILENYSKIIIPSIDDVGYWCWFCIDMTNTTVYYFDPLACKAKLNLLTKRMKHIFSIPRFETKIPSVDLISLPSTITSHDSGVYALCTINSFVKQYPFVANEEDIKILRDFCCLDILSIEHNQTHINSTILT